MPFSANQRIILEAALRGLPMHRFCLFGDSGDSFGCYATIKNADVREAISAWVGNLKHTFYVRVYRDQMDSSYAYYYAIDEDDAHWREIDDLPLWPLNDRLMTRLKEQLKPHERKSKSFFSERNRGLFAFMFAAAWISFVGLGGTGNPLWVNAPASFSIILGLLWLYRHFIGDARTQERFRNKVHEALIAEGVVLYPSPSSTAQLASVTPFRPKPAS